VEKERGLGIDLSAPEVRVARDSSEDDLAWSNISELLTPEQLSAFDNSSSDKTL
jgi:hypothetical protein